MDVDRIVNELIRLERMLDSQSGDIYIKGMTHGMLIGLKVEDADLRRITSKIIYMIEDGTPKEQIVKYVLERVRND